MKLQTWLTALIIAISLSIIGSARADKTLLNVSYDPTREFFQELNTAFIKHWQTKGGEKVTIQQSHGGSSKQARSVIDGLAADVVTLALAGDIDAIAEHGKLLPEYWQTRLPRNSSPYTSTIVFLVRKGNPKGITDWHDLANGGFSVITPNPKTSGGARWNYLAAWEFGKHYFGETRVQEFVSDIYKNVAVLDSGSRGSTTTFVEQGIGDVLIAWENEAFLAIKEYGPDKFEIIVPSVSVLAEPPVALIDKVVDKKGTRAIAESYLNYLYSEEAQHIAAKHYFRPTDENVAAQYAERFAKVKLFKISDTFGNWKNIYQIHFKDGGIFDQIYLK